VRRHRGGRRLARWRRCFLLAADDGDLDAEASALSHQAAARLHPGPTTVQATPFGDPPVDVTLARS
jgi:hypothetical protein